MSGLYTVQGGQMHAQTGGAPFAEQPAQAGGSTAGQGWQVNQHDAIMAMMALQLLATVLILLLLVQEVNR